MGNDSCTRCGSHNDDGARFCAACGASLAPQILCPHCTTQNPLGRAFCGQCGGSLEHAGWGPDAAADPGAVIDGTWERGGDELIRRVDPEDARRFLGGRTVRVPAGTVGVVLVDGVVERVLPPGERTSVSLFQRVANFFRGRERTAFYLVDQRPFPVPFVVRTRPNAAGELVKSQVLVTFSLPKGDRDALARFIANVVRERPRVTTSELYNLLRPEVARAAEEVLERAASGGPVSYADAEVAIRQRLTDAIGARYGLSVDAILAPLTTVASVHLQLGLGASPRVRACPACRAEIPAAMRFCEACGAPQPAAVSASGAPDAATPLFTADGREVELDLVIRVSGQQDDFSAQRLTPALVAAAATHLRGVTYPALAAPGGLAALEAAVRPALVETLSGLGVTLVAVAAVDVRSRTGQWALAARADLERAAEDVRLGLSWLEQRDAELDLEQLTLTRVLRAQQQRRDQRFADDAAQVADRERRDDLADRGAALDLAKVARDARVTTARDEAEQARQRAGVAHQVAVRHTQVEAELADLRARRDLDHADLERRKRLELELSAIAEEQQVAKLRAMAQIERDTQAQRHAQDLEKRAALVGLAPDQMIAAQAAELARTEGGGAAWAAVLAGRGADERRHAEEQREIYAQAMGAMAQVASSRGAPTPVVAGAAVAVPTARACAGCGAALKAEAKFCGACGATG